MHKEEIELYLIDSPVHNLCCALDMSYLFLWQKITGCCSDKNLSQLVCGEMNVLLYSSPKEITCRDCWEVFIAQEGL